VADEARDVEAGDAVLFEQRDRMRLGLREHRDEHVPAVDRALAGALRVHHRALEHPAEAERLHGLEVPVTGQVLERAQQLLHARFELLEVRPTRLEDLGGARLVQQREQQVLEGQELVATPPGVGDGALERGGQVG
jgi:hypothetical protein